MIQTDFFENIEEQFSNELPLVVYRKPKEANLKALFQDEDNLVSVKDFTETGFVFAPFDQEKPTLLLRPDQFFELETFDTEDYDSKHTLPLINVDEKKEFHLRLVEKGLAEIERGNFDKVVLSRCLRVPMESKPLNLFKKLLGKYENAFCYLWYHPKVGLWMGATPEILLRVENKKMTTISLAGTQKFRENENIKWEKKELKEQKFVTDYIVDALEGKVSNLTLGETESIRAGNLLHLRTKISANLNDDGLNNVLKALHPTPAVCGLPRKSSEDFILANENYAREFYTGYLGELNFKVERKRNSRRANQENQVYRSISKQSTLFVNLRCLKLLGNEVLIYVGGGITKESDPENEWDETVSKSKTMLNIL
ncbi:chorismate-binding protein [Pseudozobellia sp. WGM2]|uniref:chorismate-binding protein n=1 Tax=Pseudozobellia sp. WGM2 TaxID=2787625 RepID=UPI001AE01E41|nr:chorismate-binding protein [Pseudozobellia sp. WGM2]